MKLLSDKRGNLSGDKIRNYFGRYVLKKRFINSSNKIAIIAPALNQKAAAIHQLREDKLRGFSDIMISVKSGLWTARVVVRLAVCRF